jgi:DNA-3-methyladenine glycosylase II
MHPSPTDLNHRRAVAALERRDRRLAKIIKTVGPYDPVLTRNAFVALAGSIVHQQVSMAAAKSVFTRLKALCPRKRLSPKAIHTLSLDELRSAGLSRQKAGYMHDLAEHFGSGKLSTAKLRKLDDEQVMTTVTEVKGIGRWTAEMLLIFCLERPDVWPVDDLGLQNAVKRLLDRDERPPLDEIRAIAEPWRPYRTYATWYLWRSLEGEFNPGIAEK